MTILKNRLAQILTYLPSTIFDTKSILLCGGAVRYICGIEDTFRDIDVIVDNDFDTERLPDLRILNRYGGIKFKVNDKEIDLWKLRNHIIFCNTFDDVQETWLIASDALYLLVNDDGTIKLYDKYYKPYPEINFEREISDVEKKYINYKLKRIFNQGLENESKGNDGSETDINPSELLP